MLVIFGVYIYRDLWPLATFAIEPRDTAEGWILVAKIIILFVTAIVVPLLMPRIYIPVDPKVNCALRIEE
jgi:hypothetical protein